MLHFVLGAKTKLTADLTPDGMALSYILLTDHPAFSGIMLQET